MIDLPLEMTQGDPFYYEIAFIDASASPVDLTSWTIKVDFRQAFSDLLPMFSLTIDSGIELLEDTGVVSLSFDASTLAGLDIDPTPRNGDLVPSRTIFADIKLTTPADLFLVQGVGSRTVIPLKVYLGITA